MWGHDFRCRGLATSCSVLGVGVPGISKYPTAWLRISKSKVEAIAGIWKLEVQVEFGLGFGWMFCWYGPLLHGYLSH